MNIRELLESRANSNPEKVYLYFQEQEISYRDFDKQVNKAANSLLRSGILKGDHFAIMLPNCPEFLYAWFGLNKIGAVEVPVNLNLKGPEVQYILNHSESRGIVIHSDYLPVLEEILAELPDLKHTIIIGGEAASGTMAYQDWIAEASEELQPVSISEEEPAVIIYTSGTTGRPKAV